MRLRAKQISDGISKCQNKDHVDFATVLADLGPGGDILIVASQYAHSGFDELLSKATSKGVEIEVIGKLREMPTALSMRDKTYCGIDKLPPARQGGRWVLEMHDP